MVEHKTRSGKKRQRARRKESTPRRNRKESTPRSGRIRIRKTISIPSGPLLEAERSETEYLAHWVPSSPVDRIRCGLPECLLIPPPQDEIPRSDPQRYPYDAMYALGLTCLLMMKWPWRETYAELLDAAVKGTDYYATEKRYFAELVEEGELLDHVEYCQSAVVWYGLGATIPDSWFVTPNMAARKIGPGKGLFGKDRKAMSATVCDMELLIRRLEPRPPAMPRRKTRATTAPLGLEGPPNDGKTFFKPAYFKQWNIGDELLRRNATDAKQYIPGKVRREKQVPRTGSKGKQARYRYSKPDAQRCWPEKFAADKEQLKSMT